METEISKFRKWYENDGDMFEAFLGELFSKEMSDLFVICSDSRHAPELDLFFIMLEQSVRKSNEWNNYQKEINDR